MAAEAFVENVSQAMALGWELYRELEDQLQITLDPDSHGPNWFPGEGVELSFGHTDLEGMFGRPFHEEDSSSILIRVPGRKRWGWQLSLQIKIDGFDERVYYREQPFDIEQIVAFYIRKLKKRSTD